MFFWSLCEQDIARLEVAVNQPVRVRMTDAGHDDPKQGNRPEPAS